MRIYSCNKKNIIKKTSDHYLVVFGLLSVWRIADNPVTKEVSSGPLFRKLHDCLPAHYVVKITIFTTPTPRTRHGGAHGCFLKARAGSEDPAKVHMCRWEQ